MAENALEDKVNKLAELAEPKKEEERGTLANRVSEAIRKSVIYTMGKVRGVDDEGMPKDFAIGEYNKEERFFKGGYDTVKKIVYNVAETLVTYLLPKKSKEERKKFMDTLKDAKMFPDFVLAKFGIDIEKFKGDLMMNGKNIMQSENLQKIIRAVGQHFSESEVEEVKKEITNYGFEFKDKLYGLAEKALGKLGYKLEPKNVREPSEVVGLLEMAYGKKIAKKHLEDIPYLKAA